MARTIGGTDVGRAIADALRDYTEEVSEAIRKEVDDAATDIKRTIQTTAPADTGKYRKGWRIHKRDSKGVTSRTVHNAKVPGLPHLLEHGHAKRGGGRVAARPHIARAAEPRLKEMEENIKQIIENGG
jgi:hypothetical protein